VFTGEVITLKKFSIRKVAILQCYLQKYPAFLRFRRAIALADFPHPALTKMVQLSEDRLKAAQSATRQNNPNRSKSCGLGNEDALPLFRIV
jgi:hypothetical protein